MVAFLVLGILNIGLSGILTKLFLAKNYKKHNYSLESLKSKIEYEKIKENVKREKEKNKSRLSAFEIILTGISMANKDVKNEKLEREMDYNSLKDYEKNLVRKGDYDPTNFEYPENEEPLDEDDFYSDDESWKD